VTPHDSLSAENDNSLSEQQEQERHAPSPPSFTAKALLTGLLLGTLLCHINIHFGLLNGFSDELSLEAVLLGFAILQSSKYLFGTTFTPAENVLVSTIAGTMGLMPSVAGVVSSLVAVEFLGPEGEGKGRGWELDEGRIAFWGIGVGLFALPFIVLFRGYFVDKAELPWPSAKAAGTLVKVVHGTSEKLTGREAVKRVAEGGREDGAVGEQASSDVPEIAEPEMDLGPRILLWSLAIASILVSLP
jgi:uncharacterized oligopeptide transporter (OPT) family protein